ncbi:MAG: sulfatase-like hydrolase/transferase, partial [Bacteroidota bacterium]
MTLLHKPCLTILAVLLLVSDAAAQQQPNVLYVLTDDQRYDAIPAFNRMLHGRDSSALGYVESPRVDQLAAEGTTFINTYCQAMGCAPSRASLLYGRYPFRSGIYEFEYHNNKAEHCAPSLPEQMADLGYQTMHVGKLGFRIKTIKDGRAVPHQVFQTDISFKHLGKDGLTDWGKDWFYELDGVKFSEPLKNLEYLVSPGKGITYLSDDLEQYTDRYIGATDKAAATYDWLRHYSPGQPMSTKKGMIIGGVSSQPAGKTRDGYYAHFLGEYLAHENTEFAAGSRTFRGVDPAKPVFAHVGFDFPHTPVLPPASYRERFEQYTYQVPDFDEQELEHMPAQLRQMIGRKTTDHFSAEEKQQMIRDYFAFCAYGDELVGRTVDDFVAYSEKHQQPWLIVYVCGDHGWKLNDHGAISKFTPWEMDSHNPIIVVSSDKKAFPAGKVVTDFTEFVDLTPTILGAAGAPLSTEKFAYLDGVDLARVAAGDFPARDYVVGESHAVTGPRAYLRTKNYAFSMQTRPDKVRGKDMEWALHASLKELDLAEYRRGLGPVPLNL